MLVEHWNTDLAWVGRLGGNEINLKEVKEQRRRSMELDALTPFPHSVDLADRMLLCEGAKATSLAGVGNAS